MTIQQPTTDDLVDLFAERLTAVAGQAHRVATSESASTLIATIAGPNERTIWVSDEVRQRAPAVIATLRGHGIEVRTPASPGEVRDQPLGLAIAEGAIAETGSSILVEPRIASRSVTLMTETLVVLCPLAALMASLGEAAMVLRNISASGASYATFVTGPSRTADIERQLTVGVQGPSVFHVILVDDLT